MSENDTLQGIGVSDGAVEGRAWHFRSRGAVSGSSSAPRSVEEELTRLEHARTIVDRQLANLTAEFASDQEDVAAIFDAQALMLHDPGLNECVLELIKEGAAAEQAVRRCGERFTLQLQQAASASIRERAADCREVADRLVGALSHEAAVREESDLAGRVVVARELPPGEAVWLLRAGAVGLVIEHGGTTSHTAIVARALGVPAVVGVEDPLGAIEPGALIEVDGDGGLVRLHPSEKRRSQTRPASPPRPPATPGTAAGPCLTADGERVHLAANLELPEELSLVSDNGAEGIGLYRSEFLLIETDPELPDEEQQVARYRQLLRATAPHDLVVRTYDLGGRKLAREVLATREEHPSLGLRGIRILDLRQHLFRTQLRALLRAAQEEGVDASDRLKILLPMVSNVGEVDHFREFLDGVVEELSFVQGTPAIGAMIETPAAALIARSLGEAGSFLAIGTNDLVQYTLAAERDNEHVADLYQPFHPAVLHLLRSAVEGATAAGVPISVCGELAADPMGQVLLMALGIRRLSLHPARIPMARELIPALDSRKLQQLAEGCLQCATAEEVLNLVAEHLAQLSTPLPS